MQKNMQVTENVRMLSQKKKNGRDVDLFTIASIDARILGQGRHSDICRPNDS
jgi:hypothetical protein